MSFSSAFDIERRKISKIFSRGVSPVVIASLLLVSALLLVGCGDLDDNDTNTANNATAAKPSVPSKGLITATPNPVPAGQADLSKTKISWNTKTDMGPVYIFVSTNGEPEVQFASGGQEGSAEAPWIQSSVVYDFRLYAGEGANRQLIDHVEVTRK